MKIAHIGNTSGIASEIAEEQKRRGDEVEVFVFNELQYKQFGGTYVNYTLKSHGSINLRFFSERKRLFDRLQYFDVWHYHYPYGSLKENIRKHRRSQALLNHYHGDDIRNKLDNGFCAVSTPDLLNFAPNGIWVPTPVNISYIRQFSAPRNREKVKVAHYPFYKNYPGYSDYYSRPLSNLEKRGKCEVITIIGKNHPDTLSLLGQCDIVVGKIIESIGWFGKFELEGMTLGKPVIGFVGDDLYKKYHPPVWRTSEKTFEHDLETLIDDADAQKRLSIESIAYIDANHSVQKICDLLDGCYERCRV